MVERREGVEHSDRASYVKRVGRSWVDGGTEKWLEWWEHVGMSGFCIRFLGLLYQSPRNVVA